MHSISHFTVGREDDSNKDSPVAKSRHEPDEKQGPDDPLYETLRPASNGHKLQ